MNMNIFQKLKEQASPRNLGKHRKVSYLTDRDIAFIYACKQFDLNWHSCFFDYYITDKYDIKDNEYSLIKINFDNQQTNHLSIFIKLLLEKYGKGYRYIHIFIKLFNVFEGKEGKIIDDVADVIEKYYKENTYINPNGYRFSIWSEVSIAFSLGNFYKGNKFHFNDRLFTSICELIFVIYPNKYEQNIRNEEHARQTRERQRQEFEERAREQAYRNYQEANRNQYRQQYEYYRSWNDYGAQPPRQDKHEDLYAILGISYTIDKSIIKKAYRAKVLIHHPDKGGNEETFKKIQNAYEKIINSL